MIPAIGQLITGVLQPFRRWAIRASQLLTVHGQRPLIAGIYADTRKPMPSPTAVNSTLVRVSVVVKVAGDPLIPCHRTEPS